MRNFDDSFMPQRFRMPEKDTRKFYEKPEWWVAFVKWGIVVVLLLGGIGFGASYAMGWLRARRERRAAEEQQARIAELESAKERERKEAQRKAEKEQRDRERAAAKAEKERVRKEKLEAEAQRQSEMEQRKKEVESREKGPRHVRELEKQLHTASVRWWGNAKPPDFSELREGDAYWFLFTNGGDDVMIRVKAGQGDGAPAAADLVDQDGYMRSYELALLADAMKQRPHVTMLGQNAWICPSGEQTKKAAHMKAPERSSFYPAEELLGKDAFRLVKNTFRSDGKLDNLECYVEFHWKDESRKPIKWNMKFERQFGWTTLRRAVEDILQADLDAANAAAGKAAEKTAAKAPENNPARKRSSLTMNTSSLSGGSSRGGRRLGENYGPSFGSSSSEKRTKAAEDGGGSRREPERKTRVTGEDVQCVIDAGYLSVGFVE